MDIWVDYKGKAENYTRYGKTITKGEKKIEDVAKFFGIDEKQCEQRVKDLQNDKDLKITIHKGG